MVNNNLCSAACLLSIITFFFFLFSCQVGDANVSAYLPEPTPESSDVFLYWMIGSSGCGVLSALLSTLLFVAFVAMIREEEKERNRERKKKTKKKKQEEVAAHSAAHK